MSLPSGAPRLQDLLELAREPSSARRRELLRRVTDIFIQHEPVAGGPEMAGFDAVLGLLAVDMEQEVRIELANRMAAAGCGPEKMVGRLARDEIAVAAPILAHPRLLSENDLLDVVRTRGQDHLRVVSARRGLSEAVAEVIVDRGDDRTLRVLVANDGAALSRQASEAVVDRALQNPDLHEAVVSRRSLPIDLLNEMYLAVESRLRIRIRARNAELDPAVLEAALAAGRARLAAQDGALPPDLAAAEVQVAKAARMNRLGPSELVGYLRSGARTQFMVALSTLSEVDVAVMAHILAPPDLDALAIICKAAGLERAVFMTFAVLVSGDRDAMSRAQTYGRIYSEVTQDAALRTLRFWRVRREGSAAAA